MNQEQEDRNSCIKKIYDAFYGIELPPNEQIISQCDYSMEAQELREAFKGKKWYEIDCDYFNKHAIQGLSFLEFAAYRYFLPAFMLCSVKGYDHCFDIVMDTVESLLHPLVSQKLGRCESTQSIDMYTFQCRMNNLTYQQVDAIVAFLKFIEIYHESDFINKEPQLALTDYWLDRLEIEKKRAMVRKDSSGNI
jgi:hypothetical protein